MLPSLGYKEISNPFSWCLFYRRPRSSVVGVFVLLFWGLLEVGSSRGGGWNVATFLKVERASSGEERRGKWGAV